MSDPVWSAVLTLALAGWVFSILALIFRAFPERDKFLRPEAGRWGGVALFFFLLWVVALINA